MLIIALVLALIGLVALVFAVVTSNELVAWVCIGASVLGVILLIVDGIRERQQREAGGQDSGQESGQDDEQAEDGDVDYVEYPDEDEPESPDTPEIAADATDAETGSDVPEESVVGVDRSGDENAE
ncbi:hypothetical protein MB901379_02898 [Mycobacterium basiliense]|uniref:Transmembrane protein n=1 Tax=Mycobacterium basiliense TaxID=2094119 RepID=A0A3S4FRU5_9MYCO|nr:phage holin family protein [Mycobacterium basiliense]VDM89324.1 hypothetical protein MB901379_02898 [Mycobacterium basiliense]